MLVLVSINNRSSSVTNIMDFTKYLDTSIALAFNHCGILCNGIELHILFHTPCCQDEPTMPSSINT